MYKLSQCRPVNPVAQVHLYQEQKAVAINSVLIENMQ